MKAYLYPYRNFDTWQRFDSRPCLFIGHLPFPNGGKGRADFRGVPYAEATIRVWKSTVSWEIKRAVVTCFSISARRKLISFVRFVKQPKMFWRGPREALEGGKGSVYPILPVSARKNRCSAVCYFERILLSVHAFELSRIFSCGNFHCQWNFYFN